jgi:hypothetical protein
VPLGATEFSLLADKTELGARQIRAEPLQKETEMKAYWGIIAAVSIVLAIQPTEAVFAETVIHTTSSLSQARLSAEGASAAGKVFFAGGNTSNSMNAPISVVDIYDPANPTNPWSTATLSSARTGLSGTSAGNTVFFGGGFGTAGGSYPMSVVDMFDAVTGTRLPNPENLSAGRGYLCATSTGGKVFFAGGVTGGGYGSSSNIVDIYDTANPTNPWSTATLSEARVFAKATTANGRVFFAGGASFSGADSGVVDIYDTTNPANPWSNASLSVARSSLAVASAGGKVFFAGGSTGGPTGPFKSNVVDIYDTATGTWSVEYLSQARGDLSASSAGGRVFFAGGWSGGVCSDVVDIYDTANPANPWSTTTLSEARFGLGATSMGNQVFFAGGYGADGASNVVDIYTITESAPIPEPFTMLTTFLAIGSLGAYIRKHARKRTTG